MRDTSGLNFANQELELPPKSYPIPDNESARLEALRALEILDTPPEIEFDRITRLARILFGVKASVVSLVDEDRQWFKSACGLNAEGTPRDRSFCAHTIMTDKPLVVLDAALDERFANNPLVTGSMHLRFYAGVPIYGPTGMKLGALCILDTKARSTWSAVETGLLKDLAAMVSNEVRIRWDRKEHQQGLSEIGKLRSQLGLDQRSDTLTGLPDRRALESLLVQAKATADASDRFLALVYIDLDNISSVNDEHGEVAGDVVLKALASRLKSTLRSNDMVLRIAGDQFLVLLQGLEYVEYVRRPAEKLLQAAATPVALENGRKVVLSMSAGVVYYPYAGSTSVALMTAAKNAMLEAKSAGGNTCAVSISGKDTSFITAKAEY